MQPVHPLKALQPFQLHDALALQLLLPPARAGRWPASCLSEVVAACMSFGASGRSRVGTGA
eukprot:3025603-Prorocentrum_lima.AAC.1